MLVLLSGVSGAGKDTIKKELIKRMENVISLPSFTSRGPRPGEEEGVQYHFITKEEFNAYFAGRSIAYAIEIHSLRRYPKELLLSETYHCRPPQSFMYIRG